MIKIITEQKRFIRAVIHKVTGSSNSDLEQEAMIKIWQKMPMYQEQGKLKQWIGMVTANLCRDYLRSKRFKSVNQETNLEDEKDVVATNLPPEDIIDAKTRQKIILKAVDDLPKNFREVIVLYEFEEYSLEKIAARLKIPTGTVKSRLHNARKILKEKLSFLQ